MKKIVIAAIFSLFTLGLAGCQPGQNVPGATLAGAVAGGLVGSAIGSGSFAGIAAGALVGGIIGNQIGQAMDRQDRANMENAIVAVPVGKSATWRNRKHDITYTVTPTRNFYRHRQFCRRYKTTIVIRGKIHKAYGTACKDRRGRWRIIR